MRPHLDGERATPEGWARVYWPDEAIALLQTGNVTEISLDHDPGDALGRGRLGGWDADPLGRHGARLDVDDRALDAGPADVDADGPASRVSHGHAPFPARAALRSHISWISARERPLVSGCLTQMKTNETAHIAAKR